jgi:3-deoxy-D-manno-octulosonic-acid transferase
VVVDLVEADAVLPVDGSASIVAAVELLVGDREKLRMMGARGRAVWEKHAGASSRIVSTIREMRGRCG